MNVTAMFVPRLTSGQLSDGTLSERVVEVWATCCKMCISTWATTQTAHVPSTIVKRPSRRCCSVKSRRVDDLIPAPPCSATPSYADLNLPTGLQVSSKL